VVETKKIQRRVLEPLQSRGEAREPWVGLKRVCSSVGAFFSYNENFSEGSVYMN
jgi:hypothetical protein